MSTEKKLNFREKFEAWHLKRFGYCTPPQKGFTAFNVQYSTPAQQARWETYCTFASGGSRAHEAFVEGFTMRGQSDANSPNGCAWRSAEEAWANSDSEEQS